MGKVIDAETLYVAGIIKGVPKRTNEVIVLRDYTQEEGYGVYVAFPWSDTDSFTTSFGDGALANIMSTQFFFAVRNYYGRLLNKLPEDTNLMHTELEDSEFKDAEFKIEYMLDGNMVPTSVVNDNYSRLDGLPYVMKFILDHSN